MSRFGAVFIACTACLPLACSASSSADGGTGSDSGIQTPVDSGSPDSSYSDGASPDAGIDAGTLDGGHADAGLSDAGGVDSGTDAGTFTPFGPTAPAGGWTLIFDDEFDDTPGMSGPTNGLQSGKWNSGWWTLGVTSTSPPVQSSEVEWYGPEGIVFPGDGAVHLRLFSNPNASYGKAYESGCITTAQHFAFSASQKRTVLEARIRVPGPQAQSGGYWPAYWLLPTVNGPGGTGQWPPEIDIFEFFGDSTDPQAHLHTTGTDINQGFSDSTGTTDLSLTFHTYTMDLSSAALVFYLDGAQQWTYTDTGYISNLFAYDPMYVLINFQFGGVGGGNPTGTVPNDMVVDYFRAWQ